MKTFITLSLDTRRKRKDGNYPLVIRLTHFQKTTSISTGYSFPLSSWDATKRKVKSNYKGVGSVINLNNLLSKKLSEATDIVNKLSEKGELPYLSVKEVKDKITGKSNYSSFYAFAETLIAELKEAQRYGTARSYKGLKDILMVFTKEKDLKFNQLNYDFLRRFERFHLKKPGNGLNGLAAYMRTIKAIYNKGIKRGFIEREAYPFYKYQIRTQPTKKRAIDVSHIKKILSMKLDSKDKLFHHRNYFLLSYMLLGMSFIDMAFLKVNNIVDGRIKFQRRKTSKLYDIKITENIQEIIEYYSNSKARAAFLLPILKRDTLELQYKDAQWALKLYNKGLKEIAAKCHIEEHITSYVSRHSFATHALFKNIPLAAISSMLGHSKLSTTQIYLKSLPSNILDSYQEELNTI